MSAIASPSPALSRVLPFAVFICVLALRGLFDDPAHDAASAFDVRWLYAVQIAAAAALLAYSSRAYIELHDRARHVVSWMATAAAGVVVFVLWISLTAPWMRLGEPVASFAPVAADGSPHWPLIALRVAGAVLIVPLMEELFWRSFLMRWLDQRDFLTKSPSGTSLFALVASSAVFALAHDLWLAGLLAGLIYGALYRTTANLWYPICAHALTNLLLAIWIVRGGHWSFW